MPRNTRNSLNGLLEEENNQEQQETPPKQRSKQQQTQPILASPSTAT